MLTYAQPCIHNMTYVVSLWLKYLVDFSREVSKLSRRLIFRFILTEIDLFEFKIKKENMLNNTRFEKQFACHMNFVIDLPHRGVSVLCGSVVEHQSVKSKVLRFNSLWGLRIFSVPCLSEDEKRSFSTVSVQLFQATKLVLQLTILHSQKRFKLWL